jgi:hypothetical protein
MSILREEIGFSNPLEAQQVAGQSQIVISM